MVTLVVLLSQGRTLLTQAQTGHQHIKSQIESSSLGALGVQQPLEPFSTNGGYSRYWRQPTSFGVTLIQILPYNIEIARRCPCRNTTMTSQSLIGPERSPDDAIALIGPQRMCM